MGKIPRACVFWAEMRFLADFVGNSTDKKVANNDKKLQKRAEK